MDADGNGDATGEDPLSKVAAAASASFLGMTAGFMTAVVAGPTVGLVLVIICAVCLCKRNNRGGVMHPSQAGLKTVNA